MSIDRRCQQQQPTAARELVALLGLTERPPRMALLSVSSQEEALNVSISRPGTAPVETNWITLSMILAASDSALVVRTPIAIPTSRDRFPDAIRCFSCCGLPGFPSGGSLMGLEGLWHRLNSSIYPVARADIQAHM